MRGPPTDLRIDDLTVEFSKGDYTVRPLDHLTVTIEAGTLALLLGPSGCGKTTLLSCLAAILKPTLCSITYGHTEITALTGRDLTEYRRHGVGVVFQEAAPTLAQAYAGRQYGAFSPSLGDGRALLLGELVDRTARLPDLHLKCAGPTPFSRRGDGRGARTDAARTPRW